MKGNVPEDSRSLNLSDSVASLITRLCAGSEFIYRLNIAGHKCPKFTNKYEDCGDCILPVNLTTGKISGPLGEMCAATKLFYKLERQYYLLRILQLVEEMVKEKENKPEWMKTKKEKSAEVQMNLF